MFRAVFETFVGLMALYSVNTPTQTNYHNLKSIGYQISPQIQQDTYYQYEEKSSGTAVTFKFDDSNEIYLRDNRANYTRYCEYYFIYDFDDMESETALRFGLVDYQDQKYLQISSNPTDVFNLKVMIYIEWTTPSNVKFSDTYNINYKYRQDYNFYSRNNQLDTDYFDDGGILRITIQTTPINDEEWSGTWSDGWDEGYAQGKQDGLTEGYQNAIDQGSTAATIFSGIVSVGLLPVNFFLGILNFEVFGINIGAFVSALLTVAIVIIVIKMFTGSNGGGQSD